MDEKQLRYQFMTILSESHPGLTFEEYRDSCIYLMFYHYLCLRYDDLIEENYKLHMMVRMAIRGKLQMDSFLRFMSNAAPYFHLVCPDFTLTELSFYRQLVEVETPEKKKSYARFFRKLIKKMDAWEEDKEFLLSSYPQCFEMLIQEFSTLKKDTGIPAGILDLFRLFSQEKGIKEDCKIFQPEFRYGSLMRTILSESDRPFFCGYEHKEEYIEYMKILCFMNDIPRERQCFTKQDEWLKQKQHLGQIDTVCIYLPEGVEAGTFLWGMEDNESVKGLLNLKTKGELPLILSAFPMLKKDGDIIAVLPSALLYREGRETQVRKHLVEDMNCLDTIVLLPESIFPSMGQQEVFLYIRQDRKDEDLMFFDCSEKEGFDEELLRELNKARKGRKSISGFCSCISREEIAKNDYNLNLPRYIKKPTGFEAIDIDAKKKRIEEIDQELRWIDEQIEMYRRDLELDALMRQ